jgi:syntaxin-binding protein 5
MSKYQPRRVILTHHHDHRLRFHDISPHLLSSSPALDTAYPNPLAELTICVRAPLEDSFIWSTLDVPPEEMRVQRVVVAPRGGECGVVFESGEVVLWALCAEDEKAKEKEEDVDMDVDSTGEQVLFDLRIVESDGRPWRPKMLFNPKDGRCTIVALCDVGELLLWFHLRDCWLMTWVKGFWRLAMSDRST